MALTKVTSGGLTDDSIVNADINSSAAVALSKLATDPSNATNLASGTVPTARLGSGTASSSTVLYGDQTYKAEPGGGKLGQVIYAEYNTNNQISTTTMTDTGLTATITPAATDSKILVSYILCYRIQTSVAIGTIGFNNRLMRDAVQAWYENANYYANYFYWSGTTVVANRQGRVAYQYLDSPSSTSATVYKVQIATEGGRSVDFCESSTFHQMSLMEILA